MPNLIYENQGNNTYLVYQISEADELDTMSLGMLTNNSIPGFAAVSFTQMDTTKYIKYNISAKVSVAQLFSGVVNKKRLVGVFSGIVDAMLSAEDYMLDTNNFLLNLDYIFADVSTCETVVVCLPVMNGEHKNPELGMFFKNIIFNTQFDQTENCDHVAQILNYLNSNPVLVLADFKELLEKIGKKNEPTKVVQPKPVASEPARVVTTATTSQQPAASPAEPITATGSQTNPAVRRKFENLQFGSNYSASGQPDAPAKVDTSNSSEALQEQEEKPMSMFYLLQHYSKENAAIYKAQQEAKKAEKVAGDTKKTQKVEKSSVSKNASTSFAIPGQQSDQGNPGFVIPGQPTPVMSQPTQPVEKVEQQVVTSTALSKDKCQNCGAAMSVKQVFCTSCGARHTATPTSQSVVTPAIQSGKPINFGETTVLGGQIGETTVLGAVSNSNKVDPYLIRSKNNEKIPLNKAVFRIGKERSYVDYFIGDNTAISRSHANIVNHDGEFFVVDTNSTNHTYVNGSMIQSNVEIKLTSGTKIRLANEDFEFRLY